MSAMFGIEECIGMPKSEKNCGECEKSMLCAFCCMYAFIVMFSNGVPGMEPEDAE